MRISEGTDTGTAALGRSESNYDFGIIFGYALAAIATLILIYAASAPGTAAGDFATMTAFP